MMFRSDPSFVRSLVRISPAWIRVGLRGKEDFVCARATRTSKAKRANKARLGTNRRPFLLVLLLLPLLLLRLSHPPPIPLSNPFFSIYFSLYLFPFPLLLEEEYLLAH